MDYYREAFAPNSHNATISFREGGERDGLQHRKRRDSFPPVLHHPMQNLKAQFQPPIHEILSSPESEKEPRQSVERRDKKRQAPASFESLKSGDWELPPREDEEDRWQQEAPLSGSRMEKRRRVVASRPSTSYVQGEGEEGGAEDIDDDDGNIQALRRLMQSGSRGEPSASGDRSKNRARKEEEREIFMQADDRFEGKNKSQVQFTSRASNSRRMAHFDLVDSPSPEIFYPISPVNEQSYGVNDPAELIDKFLKQRHNQHSTRYNETYEMISIFSPSFFP